MSSSNKITMLLTKKTIQRVSKSLPLYASPRLSTASLSTAFERAEGSNAVAEGSGDDGAVMRNGMYETRQEDLGMTNDAARDGPIKAVDEADMARDTAKTPWMELGKHLKKLQTRIEMVTGASEFKKINSGTKHHDSTDFPR
ncbi:hypothetical protein SESBI_51069 [Sesbania bispinosa]|nr:hypothetical protein SESBI_51069 [Sesbania bispinosa]